MLETTAVLFAVTAMFAFLNYRYIRLPTTIGVMIISLVMSLLLLGAQFVGLDSVTDRAQAFIERIDFNDVLMDVMLSMLLFAGAMHVHLEDLYQRKWSIGLMASVGVLITTAMIGMASYYLFAFFGIHIPFIYCLVFGSLISPTDPIAVLGILKKVGAPKELETTITGESLFNDGVAVVVFIVLLEIAMSGDHIDPSHIGLLFLEEAGGGLLYGFVLGLLGYHALKLVDNYQVEALITIALVISGYTLAGHLHVSGPLAVVVAGLMIGNHGRSFAMSDTTRGNLDMFWELIDEILNALLFVLIGIEILAISLSAPLLTVSLILIPIILLARLLSTSLLIGMVKLRKSIAKHTEWILTWGGLRGAISVVLALALPEGAIRDTILTATYIVVVFSILVQGLTIGPVIRRLTNTQTDLPIE